MAARDSLALFLRCNDLLLAVPITDMDRILAVDDVHTERAGDLTLVKLPGDQVCPGWDLGALLGRPVVTRTTWVVVYPEIGSRRRRFALACDRSVAVRATTALTRLPQTMFTSRAGVIAGVFRSPFTDGAPVGFRIDLQRLLGHAELAAIDGTGVVW
ncbi:MAG: hypothetical protein ACKV2T_09125 [Kofleriaceae bacterium]